MAIPPAIDEICRLHGLGYSLRDIATSYRVSHETVRQWLIAAGEIAPKSHPKALHAKRKPHPWRQHNPGAFKSDYARNEKTVPAHARPVRK